MRKAITALIGITTLLLVATPAAQVSTSLDRPISATVVGSWMTRGDQLTLLVLWRGTPGWFWRGDEHGSGAFRRGDREDQQVRYGNYTLRVDFDFQRGTATITDRVLSLRETNVVMIDFVDSVGGPAIVETRHVKPTVPATVDAGARFDAGLVVVAREPDLFAFLQCELSLPPSSEPEPILAMKREMIATTCDRLRPR